MMMNNKFSPFVWVVLAVFFLSACSAEPVIETVIAEKEAERIIETVVVTVEPVQGAAACCDAYRIGVFQEPTTLNYWQYLGLGPTIGTQYVLSETAAHLFVLSDVRFQFVPSLAKDIPAPVENADGSWSIKVEILEGATWSDGEPITADDVVFTHNVCRDLELTGYWPNYCSPDDADITVEAIDEGTVEYTFLNQSPDLSNWQMGVALSPILPEHFWSEIADEAYRLIEGMESPPDYEPEGCQSDAITEAKKEECDTWTAYQEAHRILFEADAMQQPVAGGYIVQRWDAGSLFELTRNPRYYFEGTEIIEYEDGSWLRVLPDGTEQRFYGDAAGAETLRYTVGPYNPKVIFFLYDSQEAAYQALMAGEVDYVLDPLSVPNDLRVDLERHEAITMYTNSDYDMFYLAFNMNKYPMSEYQFRQALEILIDREFLAYQVLDSVVIPLYSTMPAVNGLWYNEIPSPYSAALSRKERLELAVRMLKDAGWTWESEPVWDEDLQEVIPGEGLTMPDGQRMPALTILGPGMDYDPKRATINLWISEWIRELGMPVQTELAGRNKILETIFLSSDFDMFIMGWSLGSPAYPDYYESFWHSRNCTIESGGQNVPCFRNVEYDAFVDEFVQTSDLEHARELVYRMQVLLADQRPYIPLYSEGKYDFANERVIFPYTEALGGIEYRTGFLTSVQVLFDE
ncbi:MAG: ABC transporter substrate-binding protein [Chloroflexi bacterium]|nr:ABC transporter substrate-binding protein [Chloroflexota bacterium]